MTLIDRRLQHLFVESRCCLDFHSHSIKIIYVLFFYSFKTKKDWKIIAKDFQDLWNFPHCVGALDGKHVRITPPPNSGSYYYNYKGYHSLVLMAIANTNYEFILIDFGTNGRISDGGVLANTRFYEKLQSKTLELPEEEKLPYSDKVLPYVFVGDDAFPLSSHILKPFPHSHLEKEKRIFNYRLSRARRIIENVFGILVARFRIFHTDINVNIERIEKIVLACCVLHNFLRKKCAEYIPLDHFDIEDHNTGTITNGLRVSETTLLNLHRSRIRNVSQLAKNPREKFMEYFNHEGGVRWQDKMI